MATNTFKLVTNAAMPSSAGTPLALYTVPSSTTAVVIGLLLCNIDTSARTASVKITSSTSGGNPNSNQDVFIAKNVSIPAGSSLEIMSGNKIVLQTTDDVLIDCDVASKIDAALSIMELA